ncbi:MULTISPECIES: SGNH/GDSL hydrolase family protein [unclassified Rathayibacter]|uniref:SGNH/GDSL hydrolase family protein n=1 Tax=unclassified Rathayibacter TaxID=2609250 RepID=UPI00188B1B69|nr:MULTISPECIES: GDSL-type esterase/lipase family protein [unclassified Rathayibacter]MBF4461771.1 SGNH/GDSL hydrolase family protein [Rathayibacter sp. VKM Ac-2879]MBF4503183.1 SGNH/GDSL hydrolase family protein [Rathayibacter sp. VKM Ac-2878]
MRLLSTPRPPRAGRRRLRALAIGAVLAAAAALVPAGTASAATPTLSVLSLGDSITQAYGTCGQFADCPRNNWSTGTATAVNSFASRLRASKPGTTVTTANFAKTGDLIAGVPARVDAAVAAGVHPDVVTLLIGGNDLCAAANPVAADGYTMTTAAAFTSGATAALTKIRSAWPSATIVLSSMPNVAAEWAVVKSGFGSVIWSSGNLCRTTRGVSATGARLGTAAATASAAAAKTRTAQYNTALQNACAASGTRCDWDGGALTATPITKALIGTTDYFHPSIAGQAKIASVQWAASNFSTGG